MRYILNDSGYIEAVSFNNLLECQNKTCTEYTGTIPTGYESLAEWSENANINAYKIVDGNLIYDSNEDTRLQALWESQKASSTSGETNTNNYSTEEQVVGTWEDGKPIYRKAVIGTTSFDSNPVSLIYNANKIINYSVCVGRNGVDQCHPLSGVMADANHANPLFLDTYWNEIRLYIAHREYQSQNFYGWIEYTKITD